MEPNNQQDLIDRFLRNELSAVEKKSFQQLLENDVVFAKEVKMRELISKGIEQKGNDELRNRFQKIKNDMNTSTSKKPKRFRRIMLRVLGSAAMVILLAWAYFHFTMPPSADDLFAKFYEPSEVNFGTRSNGDELKASAETAYREKKYKDAIMSLIVLTKKEPGNMNAKLALGNSFLQIGGFNSAENSFQEIVDSNDKLFIDQANWYLALTYLKSGQTKKCKKLLKELSEKEGADFQNEAKELYDKIANYE